MTAAASATSGPVARWRGLTRDQRRFWTWALAGVAVGLAVRVAWALWVAREPVGLFDPARYLGYARQIADGNGMIEPINGQPTAYYPPGYPWFLGIVAWVSGPFTGNVPLAATLVQAGLGALTALFGGLVARRLAGVRAGIVAVFVLALYPNLVFHSGALLGETLYDFLFLAFLAVLVSRPWDAELRLGRVAVAGVLLGLAVMVRPISLAVIPVVLGCWWLARRDKRQVAAWSGVLLLGVGACILPWTVRNAVRMDAFVFISTNTGDNLCMGHGEGATGAFRLRKQCDTDYTIFDGPEGEVKGDQAKLRTGIDAILEHPGKEPWLTWRRFFYMWVRSGDHDGVYAVQSYRFDRWMAIPTEARLSRLADVVYYGVCAGGVVGLVLLVRRRRPEDLVLVGSAVMTAAVPLAFFGDARFKVPVIPLLIVIAATVAGDVRTRSTGADTDPDPDPDAEAQHPEPAPA